MTLDLDALESLAKAALSRGEEDCEDLKDWLSAEEFMSNALLHPVDAHFAEAMTPSAILELCAEVRRLRESLQRIADIENEMVGGDWDEIEAARRIALHALTGSAVDTEKGKQ